MSFNWNVYKIFKNGKRAKAPIHTFYYEGSLSEAYHHFSEEEIKLLGDKAASSKFHILNENSDQQWEDTRQEAKDLANLRKIRTVLAPLAKKLNLPKGKKISTALVYTKETNWNWQWAAVENATNKYIAGLSEEFKNYEAAYDWINTRITQNQE